MSTESPSPPAARPAAPDRPVDQTVDRTANRPRSYRAIRAAAARLAVLAVALLLVALAGGHAGVAPARAQGDDGAAGSETEVEETVPLDAFFGVWRGTGISEDKDQLFFSMSDRDMDVDIFGLGEGFRVRWTTVIRSGDPDSPDRRRRSAELSFEPVDRPGLYRATTGGSPLDGEILSWARLHGRTLSVYQMMLNEEGGFDIAHYDRTLEGGDRMALVFRRLRDGQEIRAVRGTLTREGDRP
ncbi:MAG: hypothetical protein RID91_21545 [Azospirillaceae bacterium]